MPANPLIRHGFRPFCDRSRCDRRPLAPANALILPGRAAGRPGADAARRAAASAAARTAATPFRDLAGVLRPAGTARRDIPALFTAVDAFDTCAIFAEKRPQRQAVENNTYILIDGHIGHFGRLHSCARAIPRGGMRARTHTREGRGVQSVQSVHWPNFHHDINGLRRGRPRTPSVQSVHRPDDPPFGLHGGAGTACMRRFRQRNQCQAVSGRRCRHRFGALRAGVDARASMRVFYLPFNPCRGAHASAPLRKTRAGTLQPRWPTFLPACAPSRR